MANTTTVLDEWSVKDLEDGSSIRILVHHCTEMGNQSKPGIQIIYMGNIVNFEPVIVERLAYQAQKAGVTEYLLEDRSWVKHPDQYVKIFLVTGEKLKAKALVKTRSSGEVSREYELPFTV